MSVSMQIISGHTNIRIAKENVDDFLKTIEELSFIRELAIKHPFGNIFEIVTWLDIYIQKDNDGSMFITGTHKTISDKTKELFYLFEATAKYMTGSILFMYEETTFEQWKIIDGKIDRFVFGLVAKRLIPHSETKREYYSE